MSIVHNNSNNSKNYINYRASDMVRYDMPEDWTEAEKLLREWLPDYIPGDSIPYPRLPGWGSAISALSDIPGLTRYAKEKREEMRKCAVYLADATHTEEEKDALIDRIIQHRITPNKQYLDFHRARWNEYLSSSDRTISDDDIYAITRIVDELMDDDIPLEHSDVRYCREGDYHKVQGGLETWLRFLRYVHALCLVMIRNNHSEVIDVVYNYRPIRSLDEDNALWGLVVDGIYKID